MTINSDDANVHPYEPYGLRKALYRFIPKSEHGVLPELKMRTESALFGITKTPPRRLRLHISPGWFDFHATGRDQLEFMVQVAGLQPSDRFLDVACGVGRLAIPLAGFLNAEGSYSGFDVFEKGIAWCKEYIEAKDPRFHFQFADVKTDFHPSSVDASDYRFEYPDQTFDFCYAGSIFTHLTLAEAENYLRQVRRVLKPGGRFVSTWLTYSDEARKSIPGMQARLDKFWPCEQDGWRFRNPDSPGESVAFEQRRIRELYADAGLTVMEPFRPDPSYNLARIPKVRAMGQHLHHCVCIVAVA